jgi:hypothetical protein
MHGVSTAVIGRRIRPEEREWLRLLLDVADTGDQLRL